MASTKNATSKKAIPLKHYMTGETVYDSLHSKMSKPRPCRDGVCFGSLIGESRSPKAQVSCEIEIYKKANDFLMEFYSHHKREDEFLTRWEQVLGQLKASGTYDLTFEELEFGVKTAWRNAARCSARILWDSLVLIDHRNDVETTDEMFKAICDHIDYGTNGGALRPAITVFRPRQSGKPDLRIWNGMGISFAGYSSEAKNDAGEVVEETKGDLGNLDFTRFCQRLGWSSKGTHFDILPFVLSDDRQVPVYYDIPEELVMLVPITHPTIKEIGEMGLKWHALPMVSGLLLEVGGLEFPAAPFAGWYTSVEIGTRDLLEPNRYNLLEKIGNLLGLDTGSNASLWKDRVAIEMNLATLYSFAKAGASIVDQHTVSEQFQTHFKEEMKTRGGCPSDWVWLNPSQSGSLTPLYHQEMLHYTLSPALDRQELPWTHYRFPEDGEKRIFKLKSVFVAIRFAVALYRMKRAARQTVKVFYATETGTAKKFATRLANQLSDLFNVKLIAMNLFDEMEGREFDITGYCLFVTSTFGNGDPPRMAEKLASWLDKRLTKMDILKTKAISIPDTVPELDDQPVLRRKGGTMRKSKRGSTLNQRMSLRIKTLKDFKFAVFALGSSAYPHFCGFGKWLDDALGQIRGTRLANIGLGDELGDREGEFKKWTKIAITQICNEAGVTRLARIRSSRKVEIIENIGMVARWRLLDRNDPKDFDTIISDLQAQHQTGVAKAKLVSKKVLSESHAKVILVRLEFAENVSYVPGDHLAVYPVNADVEVDLVLSHMAGLPADPANTVVQLQEPINALGWVSLTNGLPSASLRRLLKYHLSLSESPSQELIRTLSKQARDPDEKAQLEDLGHSYASYSSWRSKLEPSISDLFRIFDSLWVDSAQFVRMLGALMPRFYSIASCKEYLCTEDGVKSSRNPHVDLLLNVVIYQTPGGLEKRGLCSTFLDQLKPGQELAVYHRSAHNFHLPNLNTEVDVPLILIGAGSGLAPFKGFWEQVCLESQCEVDNSTGSEMREDRSFISSRARKNKLQLFYGCFDKKADILRDETDRLALDVLTRFSAFSREPNEAKKYVQDLILEEGKSTVADALIRRDGIVYICGKIAMAEAVHNAIVAVISRECGISLEKAKAMVQQMKDEGRYNQDIFGN